MPLSAVYTDLDGTLLGKFGALFADAEGDFSMRPARALEACHRAGVEVVIMSGRRESTVASDARLLGQRSYIYEAGCGVVIDGERTYLTGDWVPDEAGTPAEKLVEAGIPDLLFEHFDGRLEWHSPWHTGRELSLLMRGKVDVEEANELIARRAIRTFAFWTTARSAGGWKGSRATPTPTTSSPAGRARRRRSPSTCAPVATRPRTASPSATRSRTSRRRARSDASSSSPTGPSEMPLCAEALAAFPNATVTEGAMGDGFYEAVVSTLAERR